MDAFKDAFEAELQNFVNRPESLPALRQWYRRTFQGPLPEDQDPVSVFIHVITHTDRLKQIEKDDAIKGGIANHMLEMLDRMTIPDEAAQAVARHRFAWRMRVTYLKAKEILRLIRVEGWSKEAIQTKKDEIGWGESEKFQLECQLREAHDREREVAE